MKEETQHRSIAELWDELQEYHSIVIDEDATQEDKDYARKSQHAVLVEALPRIHSECDIAFCRGGSMIFYQGCSIELTANQAEEYAAAFQIAAFYIRRRANETQNGGGE